jgi:hypothetical protein
MCDIGIDNWNLFDVAYIVEVASFSREKSELDAALINDDGGQSNLAPFSQFLFNLIFW